MKHLFLIAVAMLTTSFYRHPAHACQGRTYELPVLAINPMATADYNGNAANTGTPFTIYAPTGFSGICTMNVLLYNDTSSPALRHTDIPAATLTHWISAPFFDYGGPMGFQISAGPGQAVQWAIPFHIPGGQTGKPAGTYHRRYQLILRNNQKDQTFYNGPFDLYVHVSSACTLPPPSLSQADFSQAISDGTVPVPYQQHITIHGAGCSGPARLTLVGESMKQPNKLGSSIPFIATAVLSGTPVVLDTRIAAIAVGIGITAPSSGDLPITLTVPASTTPLAAGTYSSTLRVSLEPAQ